MSQLASRKRGHDENAPPLVLNGPENSRYESLLMSETRGAHEMAVFPFGYLLKQPQKGCPQNKKTQKAQPPSEKASREFNLWLGARRIALAMKLEVHLLSGSSCTLECGSESLVKELKAAAQGQLQRRFLRILGSAGQQLELGSSLREAG